MTEKQTETILDNLEIVEDDITKLETALHDTGLKNRSKQVKSFHKDFIKLIRLIEQEV